MNNFSFLEGRNSLWQTAWHFSNLLEKQLRDAAAAEVAVHGLYGNEENGDKASRKRKHMNADEKAKQKYVRQ